LGTQDRYADRVVKQRYVPPTPEVAEHVNRVVELFRKRQEIEDQYKTALTEVTAEDRVPIAYMAAVLGIERKTVYRHLGRAMS
jgi:transcriptional regulator of acetoin/glycerol metabolism